MLLYRRARYLKRAQVLETLQKYEQTRLNVMSDLEQGGYEANDEEAAEKVGPSFKDQVRQWQPDATAIPITTASEE